MTQPWAGLAYRCEDSRSAITVLNIGRVDDDTNHQTNRVGNNVALSPINLFTRIEASNSATLGRLHTLTIDHTGCGAGLATFQFPRLHNKMEADGGE